MALSQRIDVMAGTALGLPYYRRQVRNVLASSIGTPLLIWQMGKVGSTSLEQSLRDVSPSYPVLRAHLLGHEMMVSGELYKRARRRGTREYLRNVAIREEFLRAGSRWKVLTILREPMSRNISSFFQNLDIYIGRKPHLILEHKSDPVSYLMDTFVSKFDHNRPTKWVAGELEKFTGIALLDREFPVHRGCARYSSGRFDAFVVRVEDIDGVASSATRAFLEAPDLALRKDNVGDEKWYSGLYREFRARRSLPQELVLQTIHSPYGRTFYSDTNEAAMLEKYSADEA